MQRRRPGLDGRLRDDRVPRRDRGVNGYERFERSENPDADLPSENDGPEKGNQRDEPIFDSFGGQGMPVAPFAADIPPPSVLIPVPGAGYDLYARLLPSPPPSLLKN